VAALEEHSGTLTHLLDSVLSKCGIAFTSGDLPAASTLADEALDIAVREGRPARLGMAHAFQILAHFYRGDLVDAEEHFTTALAFFDDPHRASPTKPARC
jgi:hypothetical protein